eukprot:SAG11_NODE_10856_length_801_cov_0.861823_2_plen_31_part_01
MYLVAALPEVRLAGSVAGSGAQRSRALLLIG